MLCSTIIPTINRPSLERAVKSVLDQDLDPHLHQIIVVNDSGQLLPEVEWLKSSQIIIVNTNRCERCVARNVGAAVASGKYLHFLDDDDYLLPGGIQALLKVAEFSNCDWIYGALNRVDDEGLFMSVNCPKIKGNIFALLVAGESIHLGPSLIKRDAFFRVGGFDSSLKTTEDRDLESRIALTGDFDRTDYLVASIRVGQGGSSTTNWSTAKQDSQTVREKALDAHDALARILDSVRGDVHLRGRCCRAYLLSAGLNLLAGRFFTACSRLYPTLLLAGLYTFLPEFWRGLLYRSYWHAVEKYREEKHYATHCAI